MPKPQEKDQEQDKEQGITLTVTYVTQVYVDEWVKVDRLGFIRDAGPMLKMFKNQHINDVKDRKMVTKITGFREEV